MQLCCYLLGGIGLLLVFTVLLNHEELPSTDDPEPRPPPVWPEGERDCLLYCTHCLNLSVPVDSDVRVVLYACSSLDRTPQESLDCIHNLSSTLLQLSEMNDTERQRTVMEEGKGERNFLMNKMNLEIKWLKRKLEEKTRENKNLRDNLEPSFWGASSSTETGLWQWFVWLVSFWSLWPFLFCCCCCSVYCVDQFEWVTRR